jgi:protein ImuA
MSLPRDTVLRDLHERIEQLQEGWHPRRPQPLSLGIAALDAIAGDRLGLVELVAAVEGAGATTLALLMAAHACGAWKTLVVVDGAGSFYPPAAAAWGIPLERSIVVRPRNQRDILLATNQSLRCPAVGAVIGWHDELRTIDARRLQLAAEAGGGVGFLLRPMTALKTPSFAQLRLRVSPVASADPDRRLRVDVLRGRGKNIELLLEVDHETGALRVLPELVPATAAQRAPRVAR